MIDVKPVRFAPPGHICSECYASAQRILLNTHESAYVLAEGRPVLPAQPIDDVRPWRYSGNRSHPTEKSVATLRPTIEAITRPGDVVSS